MKLFLALGSVVLALMSCSPHYYAGSYLSRSGQMIEIEPNGFMHWSPVARNRDRFQFVGKLSDPQIKGDASIIQPSSVPQLGTRAVLKQGGTLLEVDWRSTISQREVNRATRYQKSE